MLQTGCKELGQRLQLRPGLAGKLPMRQGQGPQRVLVQKECCLSLLCTSQPSFIRWHHLVLKVVGPCIPAQEGLVYWEPEELHAGGDYKLCGLVSDDSHLQGRAVDACRKHAVGCNRLSAQQPVHACRGSAVRCRCLACVAGKMRQSLASCSWQPLPCCACIGDSWCIMRADVVSRSSAKPDAQYQLGGARGGPPALERPREGVSCMERHLPD